MADRNRWADSARWLAENWPDLVAGSGAIAVVRGVWLWSPAAAWIVAGLLAIAFALVGVRAAHIRQQLRGR